jgi:hypothetical protein
MKIYFPPEVKILQQLHDPFMLPLAEQGLTKKHCDRVIFQQMWA